MRYHGQMLGWTKRLFALLVLVVLTQWPGSGRGEGGGGGSAPDRDLEERLKLVTVPGAHFRFLPPQESGTESRAAESLQPVPCPVPAVGLCDINWLSAPTRWESTFVGSPAELAALPLEQVLLRTQSGRPLLIAAAGEVVVMMDLRAGDVSRPGARIRQWPYFNYLLYVAACRATNQTPLGFAAWQHGPLLWVQQPLLWLVLSVGLWLLCGTLFLLGRSPRPLWEKWSLRWVSALHCAAQSPSKSETELQAEKNDPGSQAGWNEVGFTRPLSGLLTLLGAMFLLIGPYFALQSYLSGSVQPFPEADGLWKNTGDTLFIVWLTFDMGTQTALVKYFAEHRPAAPEEALKDVQFYVWWQIMARTVEATLLIGVALRILPHNICSVEKRGETSLLLSES